MTKPLLFVSFLLALGCASLGSSEVLDRAEVALRIAQCVEKVLPLADSSAAKPEPGSSSPAAALPSVPDAGAADSGHGDIDTQDPWWRADGGAQ